ncbi:hypothetical protein GCM10008931_43880 [Oceanobacillus oncorhynchi subsp. oncorhynchi]|uniref:hypothetical protein n=1 Tax=Oceanobacillus oncorhynchi TaxID=545501 RepID=UPI0031D309CD
MYKFDGYEYIEFLFENVESVIVPRSKIRNYQLGEIREFDVDYSAYLMTDYFSSEINYDDFSELSYDESEDLLELVSFEGDPLNNNVEDKPHLLGSLIKRNDIVAINFLGNNGRFIETVFLPAGEPMHFKNTSAKSVVYESYIEVAASGEFMK